LLASFFLFLILSGLMLFVYKIFSPAVSLSIAFSCGMILLGLLMYVAVRKIYPDKLSKDLNYLLVAIGINALLGCMAISIKAFIISRFYYLIIFEILIGLSYLLILWLLKTDWLRKIPEKILLKK